VPGVAGQRRAGQLDEQPAIGDAQHVGDTSAVSVSAPRRR
jgi:hypothetical protein